MTAFLSLPGARRREGCGILGIPNRRKCYSPSPPSDITPATSTARRTGHDVLKHEFAGGLQGGCDSDDTSPFSMKDWRDHYATATAYPAELTAEQRARACHRLDF
jgi:hypothetical protein